MATKKPGKPKPKSPAPSKSRRSARHVAGIDLDKMKPFVRRIENLHADMASSQSAHMDRCKDIRGDIREIYAEAENVGHPVAALRALIKYRELEKRQMRLGKDLDGENELALEQMVNALGHLAGTPLGNSALARAAAEGREGGNGSGEAEAEAEGEPARADEERLAHVGRGVEPATFTRQ